MISPTTTKTESSTGRLRLRGDHDTQSEDWLATLHRERWVVVKGVIAREEALAYADKAYDFLENFGTGFDRNDVTTYVPDKMPYFYKGGLFHRYGASHEQFVWDIKQEPEIVNKFAQVWGTEKLVASFEDDAAFKPWPHVDQSPLVPGLHCVQGIINLLPNGPDDGGLMVMKGTKALYKELWEAFDDQKPARGWNKQDRHDHTPEQIQWLIDHGCEYHKVCAEPGDLLLDYGATPTSTNARIATYVCYKPAAMVAPKIKAKRQKAWQDQVLTSHDPITFRCEPRQAPEGHATYDHPKVYQLQEPVLTELGKKLVGVDNW